jgi:hypothetical protein
VKFLILERIKKPIQLREGRREESKWWLKGREGQGKEAISISD